MFSFQNSIRLSLLSLLCVSVFAFSACKEDPIANTEDKVTTMPKASPLAGYWKAQIQIPLIQINGAIDLFFTEQPNKEILGSGYALFDVPAGLIEGADPNEEIPFKLAQPLENCTAKFNADSTVNINAGVLDLSILSSLGGGGGVGGLQKIPLTFTNAKLSADKKSIAGTLTFLFFPLPVTFIKQ